jgi:hypothetical protein
MEVREPDEGLSFQKQSPETSFQLCACVCVGGGGELYQFIYACVRVAVQGILCVNNSLSTTATRYNRKNKDDVFKERFIGI